MQVEGIYKSNISSVLKASKYYKGSLSKSFP